MDAAPSPAKEEPGVFLPGVPEAPQVTGIKAGQPHSDEPARVNALLLPEGPGKREYGPQRNTWWDHPGDWLLGTGIGQTFVLIGIGILLLGCGALTWSLVGGNADYDTSFWHSLWISWGLFFDPGTQTGVPATDPLEVQFTAMFFSVCGFIFNLAVLGIVVDTIRTTMERSERMRSRIVTNGHTLILGWGDKTLCLVDELRHVYNENHAEKRKTSGCCSRRVQNRKLVILSRRPKEEMEQEVVEHLAAHGTCAECICYREGNPADPMELTKVSATSASDVIVVSRHAAADLADQEVIQTVVTLASLKNAATSPWEVWAEMRISENVEVVGALLPACQGIVARQAVNRMLCLSGIFPAVGSCYVELVSFKTGSQVYVSRPPRDWVGRRLAEVSTDTTLPVTLLGVGAGEALHFEADRRIHHDEPVVLLARASGDVDSLFSADPKYKPGGFRLVDSTTSALRACVDRCIEDGETRPNISADAGEPKVVLLLGCPEDIADFLLIMDLYLAVGSKVYILSERDLQWRRRELNFAYNGGIDDGSEGKMLKLDNLELHHLVGPPTAKRHIKRLPLEEADAVIILSESHDEDEDQAMAADSRNLNALVTLRSLCSDMQGCHLKDECPVLFEIVDSRTERVVRETDRLTKLGTPFFSNALETSIFAMASEDRAVFNTFIVMLEPANIGNLVARDVKDFLHAEEKQDDGHRFFSFRDLQRRVVQDTGAVLVGWRRCGGKVELNPADKVQLLPWNACRGDLLVLFAGGDAPAMSLKPEAPMVKLGMETE